VGAGGRHREKHSLMVDGRDETKSFRPPFAKKMTKSINIPRRTVSNEDDNSIILWCDH